MNLFELQCDAIVKDTEYLAHYGRSKKDGAPVGSGRYPLGSGDNPYQHSLDFYSQVQKMIHTVNPETGKNYTYTEVARAMGMSTTQFRKDLSNASEVYRQDRDNHAKALREKGYSFRAIAEQMGESESTIRSIINGKPADKISGNQKVADQLSEYVDKYGIIDVGKGSEIALGVSETRMANAVALLEDQGYQAQTVWVKQMGAPGYQKTAIRVLAPGDMTYQEIRENMDKIHPISDTTIDLNGDILMGCALNPTSISSDRVFVRYKEHGGEDLDGVIELRRGCPDLDLGAAHYAQVRIAVDGTHFLKGVARYSDDVPEGYDVIFNTNKKEGTPKMDVFKEMKKDPTNPFGSSIKDEDVLRMVQKYYYDEDGNKKLSALNTVNEEGTWDKWVKTLPSQMLSKQSEQLAKSQLELTLQRDRVELDEIKSLTNPTVKRYRLSES